MNTLTATAKGAATREAIVDRAYEIARASGVEGLSIGPLAAGGRHVEERRLRPFRFARGPATGGDRSQPPTRFGDAVLIPALSQPRGLPRLRAIMHNWFEWVRSNAGAAAC